MFHIITPRIKNEIDLVIKFLILDKNDFLSF
jgi:hypothetical protein